MKQNFLLILSIFISNIVNAQDDPLGAIPKTEQEKLADASEKSSQQKKTFIAKSAKNLEMIWCPPGSYLRGHVSRANTVILTEGFYLGKYEVTQEQYRSVMGVKLSSFLSFFKGAKLPVEKVSWEDAMAFCKKLNEKEKNRIPEGWAFSLPTESQWEYACRAGTRTAYSWGNEIDSSRANYNWENRQDSTQSCDVGQYAANPWGFYDMHGNVSEWCADWYAKYPSGVLTNPIGPATGTVRVKRGGSCHDNRVSLLSHVRGYYAPDAHWPNMGFRIVFQSTLPSLTGSDGKSRNQGRSDNNEKSESNGDLKDLADASKKSSQQEKTFIARSAKNLEMIWCPPGSYLRGDGYNTNTVILTKGFYLGKYEVTQEQYQSLMGDNPSKFKGMKLPVQTVSWEDAVVFCKKLNEKEKNRIPEGWVFTLPTESQWEYACRAGTTTRYFWGEKIHSDWANYGESGYEKTRVVGSYRPNSWGFYDMHGNVWELCADWYGSYPSGTLTNPTGPASGSTRVKRGGSWYSRGTHLSSAKRSIGFAPSYRSDSMGFRVVFQLNK